MDLMAPNQTVNQPRFLLLYRFQRTIIISQCKKIVTIYFAYFREQVCGLTFIFLAWHFLAAKREKSLIQIIVVERKFFGSSLEIY